MHVHVERHQVVAVVRPIGRFFGGDETTELEHKLGTLLETGTRCVIVDLQRTQHLNSTALGVLVQAHLRAAARGIDLRLCNADGGIRSVLVVLKLVNLMPVDDSMEQAWEGWRRSGALVAVAGSAPTRQRPAAPRGLNATA